MVFLVISLAGFLQVCSDAFFTLHEMHWGGICSGVSAFFLQTAHLCWAQIPNDQHNKAKFFSSSGDASDVRQELLKEERNHAVPSIWRSIHFLYSLAHELVSKSIICPSVLQASGRFLSNALKIVARPSPPKRATLLFSRRAQQSRKLIALSLLSQMKDSGKCSGAINGTLLYTAARRMASCAERLSRRW